MATIALLIFFIVLAIIVVPQFKNHPAGLAVLFGTEMWERFSYYGGRALLILYMTASVTGQNPGLDMTVKEAGALYALYVAGVYFTNLPGGWLSDKFLGARNAVFWGGVIIAIGNLTLGLTTGKPLFYLGLFFNCIGTGLLKPNVSTMVGSLYEQGDPRRESAFSIYYMGINLGAFISPLIAGYIGQRIDWNWGFVVVGVGMLLGLILFKWGGKFLGDAGLRIKDEQAQPIKINKNVWIGLAIVALLLILVVTEVIPSSITGISNLMGILLLTLPAIFMAYLYFSGGFNANEKKRIIAIFIFYVAAALFWGAFEQAGSTLTLFADRNTQNAVFGQEFPSTWWQSVNSMWILLLSPVFAIIWLKLAKSGKEPSTPFKFSIGLLFAGLGFLILVPAAMKIEGGTERVGVIWLLTTYLLHTIGELCLSPVGLSAMTKLAPPKIVGSMMGIWFMGAALGNWIGGKVGGEFESFPLKQIFLYVFISSAIAALVMFILIPWTKKLMGEVK